VAVRIDGNDRSHRWEPPGRMLGMSWETVIDIEKM
jgi:hypothetical protein